MTCVECGALVADPTQVCARCGAPAEMPADHAGTGDEIRDAEFPLRAWGYDRRRVREELWLIADLREKGFAPAQYNLGGCNLGWSRQYEREAVDRFFAALASQAPTDLITLPAVPHAPGRLDARECEDAYMRFAFLPGVRLYVRFSGKLRRDVLTLEGENLLTRRRNVSTLPTGQELQFEQGGQVTDLGTGEQVLWIRRRHFGRPLGYVLFPGRRCLILSVAGTRESDALMTAMTESGSTALWFRKRHGPDCDVVVSPEYDLTPQLLCAVTLTAGWLGDCFGDGS